MEDEAVQYLWTLHKVNKALIQGLKTGVFVMEKWDDLTPERRSSMIEKLKGLIESGERAFENAPLLH